MTHHPVNHAEYTKMKEKERVCQNEMKGTDSHSQVKVLTNLTDHDTRHFLGFFNALSCRVGALQISIIIIVMEDQGHFLHKKK